MHTAEDDSVPVPHDALKLPRPLLNLKAPAARGVVWRPQRDDLDDEPTRAIQVPIMPPRPEHTDARQVLLARGAAYVDAALAHAALLWRDGSLRTPAMVVAAALITYLAVGGVRRGSDRTQTVLMPVAALPAAAPPAAAPIIVQQLNGAPQPSATVASPSYVEQSDRPSRSSAGSRAHASSFAPSSASRSHDYQGSAPSKPKSSRVDRWSTSTPSSSAGLPAWGAEAVRDFSSGKSTTSVSTKSHAQTFTAKPSWSNSDIPPPMASYRSSAREQPKPAPVAPVVAAKPVVVAKPVEPPKPVAPPPPSKPMTMEQVLNQVEDAAQAQRKKAGLKAPKASKRDAELDDLINGAMKSKAK